jgi:branched-chain amino acid transport system ATP-binding protein
VTEPRIEVRDLYAAYADSCVLHGVSFRIAAGETVSLLGRNGAGKSTTLKSVMGLVPSLCGVISISGENCLRLQPYQIARLGVGYCPEERGIFSQLSVRENLDLPPVLNATKYSLDYVYTLFPRLAERSHTPGTKLSGGEQQILAICRLLVSGADLLLLDEPTEGLAPVIVQQIGDLVRQLQNDGATILLVEQNFRFACSVADRHLILERGKIVDEINRTEADEDRRKLEKYLSV